MLYLPSTTQKYLGFYLFSVLLCCRLTAANVQNCVSVSCSLWEAEKCHAFSVVIWDGSHTLALGSKLPLVRATWVWTQMDALQNRGIQRQVCWFGSSFIQLIVLFQKTAGKWKSAFKSCMSFTYLHGLLVI